MDLISNIHPKMWLQVGALLAGYIFQDEIREGVKDICRFGMDQVVSQLIVEVDLSPKTVYAIKSHLRTHPQSRMVVRDGTTVPSYHIANGSYVVNYRDVRLNISINDSEIRIKCLRQSVEFLQRFLNGIYEQHVTPDHINIFYFSRDGSWSVPLFRRPREIAIIRLTPEMERVIDDIYRFRNDEARYKQENKHYKRGYLLEGPTGTGKTTCIEIISTKFNMGTYIVNLNASNMTDEVLINLVANVPIHSLIVFEEIEKQLDTIKSNPQNLVSAGGILMAMDGPQRINHGCIIIVTANSIDLLDESFKIPLLRSGRIDRRYVLHTKVE